jgi:hypothetical protein
MLNDTATIKQELMSRLDRLPDYKLQEVLDFVEFLLFKNTRPQPESKPTSAAETLQALSVIRETVQQTYGVYQGDLLAEARAEREQDLVDRLGQ